MITKCPYCEYAKPDKPLSDAILEVVLDEQPGTEDWMLWMERLVKQHEDLGSYDGVKIHIGRKHKGFYNMPTHILNEHERDLLNKHSVV